MRPRLLLAAVAAGAAALTVAAAASAGGASATTAWRSTATQGLALKGSVLGPLAGSTPLNITVALGIQNADALQQSIASGAQLAPDQFAAQFGASQADRQAVVDYLTGAGFTNVSVEPNDLFVTADGTATQAESAFNTSLVDYSVNGQTLYANTTPAQVPSSLTAPVAVLGLNDAAKMSLPTQK